MLKATLFRALQCSSSQRISGDSLCVLRNVQAARAATLHASGTLLRTGQTWPAAAACQTLPIIDALHMSYHPFALSRSWLLPRMGCLKDCALMQTELRYACYCMNVTVCMLL